MTDDRQRAPGKPPTSRSATVVLPEPVPPAMPKTNIPEDSTPGADPGVCPATYWQVTET